MQMSFREFVTAVHGMGFGAFFLLTFSGTLFELRRLCGSGGAPALGGGARRILHVYLIALCVLGWCAVFSGAYLVYPWYRAHPPAGTTDLGEFAQRKLMSSPATAGWHNLGMEWKEHVAWFAPIAITMVAFVMISYGNDLSRHRQVRKAVFGFAAAAFFAAGIAGFFGAMINKSAPVQGGAPIVIPGGASE
jgi:hypothetical protein